MINRMWTISLTLMIALGFVISAATVGIAQEAEKNKDGYEIEEWRDPDNPAAIKLKEVDPILRTVWRCS